jgi:hypothetical protein
MAALTGGEADSVEPIAVTAGMINGELAQTILDLQSIVLKIQDAAEASPLQSAAIALQQHASHLRELIDPVRSVLRPERFYQAGIVAAADGRLEIAAGFFRRALELRADHPQAHKALDDVLRKQGQISVYEEKMKLRTEEKMKLRFEYETQIIKKYLDNDWTVRHGPFAGMKYAPFTSGSLLAPKIMGSYESPIHQWIFEGIAHNYNRILNIGCGEGYYAVGFSLKSMASHVYAYDIDEQARGNIAYLARINGIMDNIHIRGECTIDELRREVANGALILCDIEGGELDLFRPDQVPELSKADIIIETHDFCCPGVTEILAQRFLSSHRIEIIYHCAKVAQTFPVLETIPITEHAFLLEEGRPRTQRWMRLLANSPGAIEPQPEQWWLPPSESDPRVLVRP